MLQQWGPATHVPCKARKLVEFDHGSDIATIHYCVKHTCFLSRMPSKQPLRKGLLCDIDQGDYSAAKAMAHLMGETYCMTTVHKGIRCEINGINSAYLDIGKPIILSCSRLKKYW